MARPRTGNKGRAILTAALELFMKKGIATTSMQAVAEKSGMSVGTLYLYYNDKDGVIAACADEFAREHLRESQDLLAVRGSAKTQLKRYLLDRFQKWASVSNGSPQAAELACAVARLRSEKIAEFEKVFVQTLGWLIQKGIEEKVFRKQDAKKAALVLACSVGIFFPFPGREHPRLFSEAEFRRSVNWFLNIGLA